MSTHMNIKLDMLRNRALEMQENVTGETFKAGDRVRFYHYGCLQSGIVVREPTAGIVWIAREGGSGVRWLHIDSVSKA